MYEYTTGGKTGYTDAARRTLVTTASRDHKDLVVVTLMMEMILMIIRVYMRLILKNMIVF